MSFSAFRCTLATSIVALDGLLTPPRDTTGEREMLVVQRGAAVPTGAQTEATTHAIVFCHAFSFLCAYRVVGCRNGSCRCARIGAYFSVLW